MTIEQLISDKLAAPKAHKVITAYADGSTKEHLTSSLGGAENWAIGESRKVGRDLLHRATSRVVRVVSVEILEILEI